ncbi:MAG: peptide chain release factor-like protein [Candidatus Aureabacteria bacterium]|nr:peptide chain release factor-like protein [Candidatus Auribacterota bacterium]NLW93560.1 peptide chain release factor-like protein [Chlamydiota bacterium]HOE26649.1 peptide chain release factor-like protein [bacterium]HQM51629.1 peptide chain release factor-like protein [bacterium]
MSLFPVSPGKERALSALMRRLGIREEDLEEEFIRSSGPGGQRLNKASTCVRLLHRPSGVSVKCSEERSRSLNRYLARKRLAARIEKIRLGRASAAEQERQRQRRRKRRRSRRAKARMLEEKRKHAEKKALRRPAGYADA